MHNADPHNTFEVSLLWIVTFINLCFFSISFTLPSRCGAASRIKHVNARSLLRMAQRVLSSAGCILRRPYLYRNNNNQRTPSKTHNLRCQLHKICAGHFYVRVTVHRNKFLYSKTNQMHQIPRFTPA